jgi:hypothetical protein
MVNKKLKGINLEKIGVYIAAAMGFWTILNSIIDLRERTAKIEIKLECLEKRNK